MSKRKRATSTGAMLDLWRPPPEAGDPVGCIATTFTFTPGLFDEQCLARFLEIESEPDREDLAFLLEREHRLGGVYAGVLVDYTQAGVEHSLRWDVLPVRVPGGKQHAKLGVLGWSNVVRVIVASANLTEPGYRTNQEAAVAVDLRPEAADTGVLSEAIAFLRSLLLLVPGAANRPPEVVRAAAFLDRIAGHVEGWKPPRRGTGVCQRLVATLPPAGTDIPGRSSLDEAVRLCRRRGTLPREAWIASPFFDMDGDRSGVTDALWKQMARGGERLVCFCVPAVSDGDEAAAPRLAAPKALLKTPDTCHCTVLVEMLPDHDHDRNRRPWHAKMLALLGDQYSALMIGSSNFTSAGMGVGPHRNAEANLLTIVERKPYGREVTELEAVWPQMERVTDPATAEWLGAQPENDEEQQATGAALPAGFLSATYRAGESRQIVLRFDADRLPRDWTIAACGQPPTELLTAALWREWGRLPEVELPWRPGQPPEKLLVRWGESEAFLPLNVEDSRLLPPPAQIECLSSDDMLWILAVADPSAAFRAGARQRQPPDPCDPELETALPIDLNPLRRYDLHATFLHRVRRRAKMLAQLRANLQRPVWGQQSLEWRLRGLIGIEPLADRLLREFAAEQDAVDEALLTLADFLIVLREVDYQPTDGSLPKARFEEVFRPFVHELADKLGRQIEPHRGRVSGDLMRFWERVVEQCRG